MTATTMRDTRKPHQKLRYWVLGVFALAVLMELIAPGTLDRLSAIFGGCQDINHMTGRCW